MKVKHKLVIFSVLQFLSMVVVLLMVLLVFDERLKIRYIVSNAYMGQTLFAWGDSWIIVLGVVMLFAISMTTVVFFSAFLKPMQVLGQAAKSIKEGDLDFTMHYNNNDENGEVFQQFDEMRVRLKDSLLEKMEIEQTRKDMIVKISHDIKTPITSIIGYANGILEGIADTEEKQEQYLQTIISKAQETNRLVDDLFLFSKLEMKKWELNPIIVDAQSYFVDVIDEIILGEQDKWKLNFNIDLAYPIKINIDPVETKRVVNNIFQNSYRYRKSHPVNMDIDIYTHHENILIRFSDDGIGVKEDELDLIFQNFYRADKARANVGEGSGLGLSISKQIMVMQKAKIWARNNKNGLSIYLSFKIEKI